MHTKYTAQLIKILFKYVQPETQRQTHLKVHLGTDPNWVIVPCRQNRGTSRIRAARDSRMPSKGLQSVNSSSRELLDPCMMSKAHVVGGFLGDFICWISTGDELWMILGESGRQVYPLRNCVILKMTAIVWNMTAHLPKIIAHFWKTIKMLQTDKWKKCHHFAIYIGHLSLYHTILVVF